MKRRRTVPVGDAEAVIIDVRSIPDHVSVNLAQGLLELLNNDMKDPAFHEKYRLWKERKQKERNQRETSKEAHPA